VPGIDYGSFMTLRTVFIICKLPLAIR